MLPKRKWTSKVKKQGTSFSYVGDLNCKPKSLRFDNLSGARGVKPRKITTNVSLGWATKDQLLSWVRHPSLLALQDQGGFSLRC